MAPILRLNRVVASGGAEVWGKFEAANPGGSVKDRIALAMIEAAERSGELAPGGTIVEPTSGNTGIGLAMVAAVKGYRLIVTMFDTASLERRLLMRAYGAEVVLTPASAGMLGAIFPSVFIINTRSFRATHRRLPLGRPGTSSPVVWYFFDLDMSIFTWQP